MTGASKAILFCIAVGSMGTLIGALPISLEFEEELGLHHLFSLRGPVNPPQEVVLVTIGRDTPGRLGLPEEVDRWPRRIHARLVDRLRAAGASVIAIDLLFDDPQTPEDDLALGDAIARARNVILTQALVQDRIDIPDQNGGPHVCLNIEKLISPIDCLYEPALAQAPFPLPKVPVCLRQYWTFKAAAGDIPTLPVVAFHAFAREAYTHFIQLLAAERPAVRDLLPESGGSPPLEQALHHAGVLRGLLREEPALAAQLFKALDDTPGLSASPFRKQIESFVDLYRSGNSRYLNFYGPSGTLPTIPYEHLFDGRDLTDLRGKVVFVGLNEGPWGQSKDGFYTVYSTPEGIDICGVEIAATAFANLLEHKPVRTLEPVHYLALLFGWGVLVAFVSVRLSLSLSALALLSLGGLFVWAALRLFTSEGLWLPLAVPLGVQAPLAFTGMLTYRYRRLSRERQNIRNAFGYYLPNAVVDQLSRNISHLNDGQVLYGICLFTDAEKYTSLSENLDPVQLTHFMNGYYQAIFKPVKANDGIVLQVVGDSVLSIWASPHPDGRQRVKACKAALEICAAMQPPPHTGSHRLPTRIGLHAGYVLMGHIGAMDHFEYRPVGDIVNTASRLESLNKQLGTRILVSADILEHVDDFLTRDVGSFVFIGKSKPLAVFELLADSGTFPPEKIAAYECFADGLSAFKSRSWDSAIQKFEEVIERMGGDGPSAFYLEQCKALRQAPPDAAWEGAVTLKQK